MSRSSRGDKAPRVKPVQKIELQEQNTTLRIILAVLLIVIAIVALAWGLSSSTNVEAGWQVVEAECDAVNCSQDFVLNYDFSDSGKASTTQYRTLTALYSDACEKAYMLFTPDAESADFGNVYTVNQKVNEPVSVDPVLYEAFALLEEKGSRALYLAPAYEVYDNLISSDSDAMAAEIDPQQDSIMAEYVAQVAEYARDPGMIDLELLGDNQVQLKVSKEYLAFAEKNEISVFVDFHWMTNAFITDYIADLLEESGFTTGYVASRDGFTRNLDTRGNAYSFNIFNRQDTESYLAGQILYRQPAALVNLRDFPMSERDQWSYYSWSDGRITTTYVDIADGRSKTATDSLLTYSYGGSCAEVLLEVMDVFIAETLDADQLSALANRGLYSVWCQDRTICYNQADLELGGFYEVDDVRYTAKYAGK